MKAYVIREYRQDAKFELTTVETPQRTPLTVMKEYIEHPYLGSCTYDEQSRSYEGYLTFKSNKMRLSLSTEIDEFESPGCDSLLSARFPNKRVKRAYPRQRSPSKDFDLSIVSCLEPE